MKQQDNKVVVAARLMDGNEVKVSTSVNYFKEFTTFNRDELLKAIKQKIEPCVDDILYYNFKVLYKDKHENKKYQDLSSLLEAVNKIAV